MKPMPQEVEVWYLLPALRKEISKVLIEDFDFSQKKVADTLKITESAVSQYFKAKRACELNFDDNELLLIKEAAYNMTKEFNDPYIEFYKLSKKLSGSKSICKIHYELDQTLPKGCEICLENH